MKKGVSNFLLGFLAGAAAGALAGILLAPDKGSETRKNLKKKVKDLSDEYNLGLSDLMDDMEPEKAKAGKRQKGKVNSE
ncbi:MAG TPA: YtxH domain-containing protein [Bacteroidales bacterium]|nr:YtxH domain-containing protein [Bacteroidales bacterium]HOX79166.1 YtxH domain-containing protein [Bacteroidales bacterium]HPI85004.1 YtxH domain-containing protein [Bacteroidales bacterium]HPM92423.1 YtxH domain-containing protein [Bacteroidales bacterium]